MLGADVEIAQLFGPGIDDLMRRFPAARRAGDNVARANGISCLPDSYFAATLQHEKHLLLGRVIVKRPRPLTRWHGGDVIPKLPRADARTDYSRLSLEALGSGASRRKLRRGGVERDICDIDDWFKHESSASPGYLDDATNLS